MPVKQRFFEPDLLVVIKRESDKFHCPLAPCLAGSCLVNELDQLLKEAAAVILVILASEEECFCHIGPAESLVEGPLDLLGCQWRSGSEVIGNRKTVIVFRKLRQCQSVEDLVRERRDERWFGEVLDRALWLVRNIMRLSEGQTHPKFKTVHIPQALDKEAILLRQVT